MIGDARSRFCESCQLHVFNVAAMTADEATALIHEREGRLCVRLFRRADGTVLTSDCPVGAVAVWRRTKQLVVACAAAVLIGAGGLLLPNVMEARSSAASFNRGPVVQQGLALWDELLVWIGIRQRFALAGAVCPPSTLVGETPGESSPDNSP
jgi:hypothetical protein